MAEEQMYDLAMKHREYLISGQQAQQASFDKTLIALLTGAIGVSFPTAKWILDGKNLAPCFLYFSWIACCMGLIAMLVSFAASVKSFDKRIDVLDDAVRKGAYEGIYGTNPVDVWIVRLNRFGLIFFILGLALLLLSVGASI